MARGRMLDKCISLSEKINELSLTEAFIYTWIIPHLDDWGRVTGSPKKIKAMIFPMKEEINTVNIQQSLGVFKKLGLFSWENIDSELVLQMPFNEFNIHQTISNNKRVKSKYSGIPENPQEILGIPYNPQEFPEISCTSKDKISKDKIILSVFPVKKRSVKKLEVKEQSTKEFDEFWEIYPKQKDGRKGNKKISSKNFAKLKNEDKELILIAVKNYVLSLAITGYSPRYPETFIKEDEETFWRDYIDIVPVHGTFISDVDLHLMAAEIEKENKK